MLEELLHAAKQLGLDGLPSEAPAELTRYVPQDVRWEHVADELVGLNGSGDTASLRALQACLSVKDLGAAELSGEGSSILHKIGHFVDRSILPVCTVTPEPDDEDEEEDKAGEWHRLQVQGEIGLHILKALSTAQPGGRQKPLLKPEVLLSAAAYTNAASDPWTTPAAARLAHDLLGEATAAAAPEDRAGFLTDRLLVGLLRPLFARSRPAAVTASGRKAEFIDHKPQETVHEDPATRPWKYEHRYAVTVFEWVVSASDQDILAKAWPSYTPILLTLLDSAETELKTRALRIFAAFWACCPPGLMDRVGLTSVFEDAVFPTVLYLPSLTPEDESLLLLNAAYPALRQLTGLSQAPASSPLPGQSGTPTDEKKTKHVATPDLTAQQRKLLDKIVREGVMTGHFHAREYVRLTTLFCEELCLLVTGMGILAMKYLKDLVPMMSEILMDPFGTRHPPALLASTKLLQAVLRCCWPRVPSYCNEILKMLAICWLNTEDDEDPNSPLAGKRELREQLTRAAAMLCAIMEASDSDTSFHVVVAPLVQKEPSLKDLLPAPGSTTD